ncbi:hypothetical protein VE03_10479, partial [Pseudogymnoascus sp. 23342-1-I1]
MATIRPFAYDGAIRNLECILRIRHPNIASIHALYHYDNILYMVGEYLELSVTELDFQRFQLQEWEIATIMTKVLDGILYLLSNGVDCNDLSMADIRLSNQGDIKIVLALHHYVGNYREPNSPDRPQLPEELETMIILPFVDEDNKIIPLIWKKLLGWTFCRAAKAKRGDDNTGYDTTSSVPKENNDRLIVSKTRGKGLNDDYEEALRKASRSTAASSAKDNRTDDEEEDLMRKASRSTVASL